MANPYFLDYLNAQTQGLASVGQPPSPLAVAPLPDTGGQFGGYGASGGWDAGGQPPVVASPNVPGVPGGQIAAGMLSSDYLSQLLADPSGMDQLRGIPGRFLEARDREQQAIRDQAAFESKRQERLGAEQQLAERGSQEAIGRMRELQAAREQALSDAQKRVADATNAYMSAQLDPNRLTRGGRGILAAISTAIGAYASTITGGPNTAKQIIDDAIKRDIDAQKEEILRLKGNVAAEDNLWKMAEFVTSDRIEQEKLVSGMADKAAAARLDRIANQRGPEEIMNAAKMLAAQKAQEAESKLSGIAANVEQAERLRKQQEMNFAVSMAEQEAKSAEAGIKKSDLTAKMKDQLLSAQISLDKVDELEKKWDEYQSFTGPIPNLFISQASEKVSPYIFTDAEDYNLYARDLFAEMRKALTGVAFSKSELEDYEKWMVPKASWTNAKARSAFQRIREDMRRIKTYIQQGVPVAGTLSQSWRDFIKTGRTPEQQQEEQAIRARTGLSTAGAPAQEGQ